MRIRRSARGLTLLAIGSAALIAGKASAEPGTTPFSGTCPNGAPVREERYCSFFVHYNTDESAPLDTMLGDFLGIAKSSQTRSIALIIAVDKYPNMPGNDLSAAAVDAARLQAFLVNEQHFDEVIVLRNADATPEIINYFLEDYLPLHADDYKGDDTRGRARLLIAYSGHGRPETPSARAAFILGSASDPNGSSGIYKMTDFTGEVTSLASHYFHVLTLINACFGANLFTNGNTGAAGTPTGPGSFAITAGSPKNEVLALIPSRGSLFFDLIINGISTGEADPQGSQYYSVDEAGSVQSQGSLTLTLALQNYLTGAFYRISTVQKKKNPEFLPISAPYFGPVQSGMAQGGFFFLSPKPAEKSLASIDPYLQTLGVASIQSASVGHGAVNYAGHLGTATASIAIPGADAFAALADRPAPPRPPLPPPPPTQTRPVTRALPPGPISSIAGHPEIKIFKPPQIYPVKGYDLSSADGSVDWAAFAKAALPAFIYSRALGWKGPDKSFKDHWDHAKVLGIDRGAYVKFDFCSPVAEQLEALGKVVPKDPQTLPTAIELVTPTIDQPQGAKQLACYSQIGVAEAQKRILALAEDIQAASGKTPLLLGNSYNLSVLTDERAERYMIWLAAYGPQDSVGSKLKLKGSNPWTLWQYSGTLDAPGIGKRTTGEVFFGTPQQYQAFRQAGVNLALAAVR